MTEASVGTYVREDSDYTSVVSPRARLAGRVGNLLLDGVYTVDVWSGASIDIRTAASPHVEEVRHEAQAGVGYEWEDFSLSGRYRFSIENDYLSNSGSIHGEADLAGNNTTLALDAYGGGDDVGRAGEPGFHRLQWRVGGRASWTQVLDPEMLISLSWETLGNFGYQASPYRFVALGGDGTCSSNAPFCIPERVPEERIRNSVLVQGRRALADVLSVGLEYRFYFDSWGLTSHAGEVDGAWRVSDSVTLSLGYRYYTQGEAQFYRPRYFDARGIDGYATRDRKLSAFYTHGLSVTCLFEEPLSEELVLLAASRATGTRFEYLAFVGLSEVYVLEMSVSMGLRFR